MREIFAYTDGSSVVNGKNKGRGGFGCYFPNFFGKERAYSQGFEQSKTGRMEVTALYYAVKAIPVNMSHNVKLIVYSDSEYVVKTFTENRIQKWIGDDWHNSSGKVKNADLWKKIIACLERRRSMKFEIRHIRSHQVEKAKSEEEKKKLLQNPHIIGNMKADKLADYKRFIKNE